MNNRHSEKWLEKELAKRVQKAKGLCVKLLPFSYAGLPDRMVLLPRGVMYFVELKSKGKKPSKIQKILHDKLEHLGFNVYIVDSEEKLNDLKILDDANN